MELSATPHAPQSLALASRSPKAHRSAPSSPRDGHLHVQTPPTLPPLSPRSEHKGTTRRLAARPSSSSELDNDGGDRGAPFYHPLTPEYPVAQVDPWPLSSRVTTSTRSFAVTSSASLFPDKHAPQILRIHHSDVFSSAPSPISPRKRQAAARQSLLDESKTKPLLLQELQAFVVSELAELAKTTERSQDGNSSSSPKPQSSMHCCLQRLQIFRDVFARVIASFTVYAPVLAQIQDEYERVIRELRSQCLQIPKLHAELQTLQTQCLHEISAHNAETKLRVQALRSQLKTTQAKLGASAAQHARDNEQLAALKMQIETLEIRSDVIQRSNNSLVNGIKRHDDTLRHVHDRAREDTMALQQVTNKYHHACDEIAELKKTIASLEEKVGGVHVAADKATIAMLTRELQDAHASLQHTLKMEANASTMTQLLQQLAHQTALNHVFTRVLDEMGVHVTFNELMTMLRKSTTTTASLVSEQVPAVTSTSAASATLSEYAEASEQLTRWIITQLQNSSGSPVVSGHGATFLTEPEEQHDLVHAPRLLVPKAADDFFPGRGLGDDVPEYLRCDGVVRNLWYPQRKLETILARVWQQKDELEKAKRVHFGVGTSASSSNGPSNTGVYGSVRNNSSNNHSVPLARVFWVMLNRMCSSKADAIEAAYNILAALERFSAKSSECRLFLLILQQELPEDARADQARELYAVHDALAGLDKERNAPGGSGGGGRDSILPVVPGRVPLADVIQLLRHVFPWKTDAALTALTRALLIDQRGQPQVDYAALLLLPKGDGAKRARAGGNGGRATAARCQFAECLRAQYLDDVLAYRQHLQHQLQQKLLGVGNTGSNPEVSPDTVPDTNTATLSSVSAATSTMVSIRSLREYLQECDVAKPVQEINAVLAAASGLSLDQILTQDALMIHAPQFVATLPTLLIKPSGKFPRHHSNE